MNQDEELYLQATHEVEDEIVDAALWAKSMALAEGDTNNAKYKYIKLRVEQIKQKPRIEEEKRIREERAESERLLQEERLENERIEKEESEIIAGLSEIGCKMERRSFGGWKIKESLGGVINLKTLEEAKEYYQKKKPAKKKDVPQKVHSMVKNK